MQLQDKQNISGTSKNKNKKIQEEERKQIESTKSNGVYVIKITNKQTRQNIINQIVRP